ncbi:DUF456 domain-containing protein [Parabacteroides sp. Marseille-P3160]|uniref:DUF456 domain-containing protein n=1 Tax=Parabacteroides sp. Marseille-P3160 TaxID=1917887 RepID=UPI0009BAB312|nr:DUF456 domain-containing protein [Parabacteroides sp. Marseille-P3160]
MDILLIILGAICLLVGLAGSILPALPGPPLSYAGLLLLHFTHRVQFSAGELIVYGIVVLLTLVLDYLIPVWGVKLWKGTAWGSWGCLIGTLGGLFIFPPWGILMGPLVGAIIGELIGGKGMASSLRAGFGAFAGFLLSTVLKVGVCLWFIFCFIRALL